MISGKNKKQIVLTSVSGLSGIALTKNMAFSSLSAFGAFLAYQAILIVIVFSCGVMNPMFGRISTGIGAEVYTKKAIGA